MQIFLLVSIKSTVHWKFSRQINFNLCTCKYHPLETTYLLCMHTNVHCTELKTVFLIETVRKFICLENFQCTVLLIETKRKICNSTFNRTVCLIESTEYVRLYNRQRRKEGYPINLFFMPQSIVEQLTYSVWSDSPHPLTYIEIM